MEDQAAGGEEGKECEIIRPGESWPRTPDEFRTLVRAFARRLVRYAFRRLGSLDDAEDIVQNILLRAYHERERFKKVSPVLPYLYRITANACTDLLRSRKIHTGKLAELKVKGNDPDYSEPGKETSALAELDRIEKLLEPLPGKQAEVIRLRFLDNLGFDEIAKILGASTPTIKSRFRYGIEKLRKKLTDEGRVRI